MRSLARAGVPQRGCAQSHPRAWRRPWGRTRRAWAGSTNTRCSPRTIVGGPAIDPRLDRPIRHFQGRGRCRSRKRRRLRQTIQHRCGSETVEVARHPAGESPRCSPGQQHGCRRAHRRASGIRIRRAGQGYVKSVSDLSNIVLKVDKGTPVLLKDVARIELVRTSAELDGEGEVASGIALQRFGQNALEVIDNVSAAFRHGVGAAKRRRDHPGLRPFEPDPRSDRDAEADAH